MFRQGSEMLTFKYTGVTNFCAVLSKILVSIKQQKLLLIDVLNYFMMKLKSVCLAFNSYQLVRGEFSYFKGNF